MPITEQPSNLKTEHNDQLHFDAIADHYAQKDRARSSSLARKYRLWSAIRPILKRLHRVGTVVEIACGIGAPAHHLRDIYQRYIGIDYSHQLIVAARTFNADNHKAQFIEGNIKTATVPPDTADVVLAIGALHHMTELDTVMRSLRRFTKPNSYFIAIEPNRKNSILQCLRWIRRKIDVHYSAEQHYFSKKELLHLMTCAGMHHVEIYYQGFFSTPFAEIIIPPQLITSSLSQLAILLDKIVERLLPQILKSLSWNIVTIAQFP